jgi:hypothetical protein
MEVSTILTATAAALLDSSMLQRQAAPSATLGLMGLQQYAEPHRMGQCDIRNAMYAELVQ